MHIVQIHNSYKDLGGEDVVVAREKEILEDASYTVSQYIVSNAEVDTLSRKLKTAISLPYSLYQKNEIKAFLKKQVPDIVHVHNFLPIITPAVFYACKELKIPVVVTLHNFRVICSNGLLYRDGGVCEDCIMSKWGLPAVKYGCYQDSKMTSIFPVLSNALHSHLNTWSTHIDKVIFLSAFSQSIFRKSHINFKEQQVAIKPNFTEDNGYLYDKEEYVLYVGRLSEEKGILNIIKACIKSETRIKVAGTGPLKEYVGNLANNHNNIEVLGFQNQEQLSKLYKKAKALVTASKMYESFGLVIIESFSYGTPVIAPAFGNAGELVTDKYNGLHYDLNNVEDLENTINKLNDANQESLRRNARKTFLEKYTREENVSRLMKIYKSVV